MVNITVDRSQIARLKETLGDLSKNIKRELATAVNATAKKTNIDMSRDVRKHLNVPVAVLKKTLKNPRRATAANPSTEVALERSKRIPLRDFGARQLKKGGVSYKVSPTSGRVSVRDMFIIRRYGGHVFKRTGKNRWPFKQKYGASPWGVYKHNYRLKPLVKATEVELHKQVERRIRFQALKAAGKLRGRQAA